MCAWIISSILSIAIYIYICRNTLDLFFLFFSFSDLVSRIYIESENRTTRLRSQAQR